MGTASLLSAQQILNRAKEWHLILAAGGREECLREVLEGAKDRAKLWEIDDMAIFYCLLPFAVFFVDLRLKLWGVELVLKYI